MEVGKQREKLSLTSSGTSIIRKLHLILKTGGDLSTPIRFSWSTKLCGLQETDYSLCSTHTYSTGKFINVILHRSLFSASGYIFKTIKLLLSGAGLCYFYPSKCPNLLKLSSKSYFLTSKCRNGGAGFPNVHVRT